MRSVLILTVSLDYLFQFKNKLDIDWKVIYFIKYVVMSISTSNPFILEMAMKTETVPLQYRFVKNQCYVSSCFVIIIHKSKLLASNHVQNESIKNNLNPVELKYTYKYSNEFLMIPLKHGPFLEGIFREWFSGKTLRNHIQLTSIGFRPSYSGNKYTLQWRCSKTRRRWT